MVSSVAGVLPKLLLNPIHILPQMNLGDVHNDARKSTLKWNVDHVSFPFHPRKANSVLHVTGARYEKLKSNRHLDMGNRL